MVLRVTIVRATPQAALRWCGGGRCFKFAALFLCILPLSVVVPGFIVGNMPPAVKAPGKGVTVVSTLTDGTAIRIGDTTVKQAWYGIVSFAVGDLGAGSTVNFTAGTFTLTFFKSYGVNPLKDSWTGGKPTTLRVVMSAAFSGNPKMEITDFEDAGTLTNAATCTLGTTKLTCVLSQAALNALKPSTESQFRLQLVTWTNGDAVTDSIVFFGGESKTPPELVLTYAVASPTPSVTPSTVAAPSESAAASTVPDPSSSPSIPSVSSTPDPSPSQQPSASTSPVAKTATASRSSPAIAAAASGSGSSSKMSSGSVTGIVIAAVVVCLIAVVAGVFMWRRNVSQQQRSAASAPGDVANAGAYAAGGAGGAVQPIAVVVESLSGDDRGSAATSTRSEREERTKSDRKHSRRSKSRDPSAKRSKSPRTTRHASSDHSTLPLLAAEVAVEMHGAPAKGPARVAANNAVVVASPSVDSSVSAAVDKHQRHRSRSRDGSRRHRDDGRAARSSSRHNQDRDHERHHRSSSRKHSKRHSRKSHRQEVDLEGSASSSPGYNTVLEVEQELRRERRKDKVWHTLPQLFPRTVVLTPPLVLDPTLAGPSPAAAAGSRRTPARRDVPGANGWAWHAGRAAWHRAAGHLAVPEPRHVPARVVAAAAVAEPPWTRADDRRPRLWCAHAVVHAPRRQRVRVDRAARRSCQQRRSADVS
jgi:hypothetical protein